MSLDVYLTTTESRPRTGSGIFIRENGSTREITREEWDAKFPGCEPVVAANGGESGVVFSANITHNLAQMAAQAGIYRHLWRPDELGIKRAQELIEPLRQGLERMRAEPELFKTYDARNGWGTYEQFLPWIQEYLDACVAHPDAAVSVSR